MFTIDLQSRTPIYEQLYKKIVELILKGQLKPNDQIPSVRLLAKDLGVNPNTISKAYTQLEHDGVIYTLAGRGSFISKVDTSGMKQKAFENFDIAVDEALKFKISKKELIDRINNRGEKE